MSGPGHERAFARWMTPVLAPLMALMLTGPVAQARPVGAPSTMGPDLWGVMPDDEPRHALPGDTQRWTDQCGADPGALQQPLALVDAVTLALCRNPQSRAAWLAYLAQAAAVGQARANLLPTVTAGLSNTHQRTLSEHALGLNSTTNVVNGDGRSINLNWTLFDFGARAATRQEAERGREAARSSHEAALQQVAATAAQAWHDAAAQQAGAGLAREAEAAARQLLAATEARVAAGALIQADALQARNVLAQATLARVRAEGQDRTAQATLARALQLPPTHVLVLAARPFDLPTEANEEALARELQDIDRSWDEWLANHPTVAAAESQVQAAQARADALFAEGLPSLSLGMAQYVNGRPSTSLSSTRTDERTVSVSLSIPLFEGFERVYRVKGQLAQIQSREADRDAARDQVAFEAWRGREQLRVAVAALRASDELLRSATAMHELALARQRSGSADAADVASARRELISARVERVQSVAAWRISRLRLLAALGRLSLARLTPP